VNEGAPGPDLAARFRRLIRADGPMPVARFMGESNAHYYATRDPLGAAGDFVTAPEISQIFGELIGLWLADLWDRARRPASAVYAELGPGRGTLAQDALRAMRRAGFTPPSHFVEGSPQLRAIQAGAVQGAHFHDDAASLPENGPLLLLANEFLDALPVRQLVRTATGWRERLVALDGERFVFVAGPQPMDEAVPPNVGSATEGTILETCPGAAAVVSEIAQRLARQGGAALFIDYGQLASRTGSTLQAVRAHRKVDPFASPGAADLTAHVDFAVLATIARAAGCAVHTATQGDWLRAMGIEMRAAVLARAAPAAAEEITVAVKRLTHPDQMGELFKVMALTAPGWPAPAGFAP
jgi:NADH dehydrogenase [ubiquinone] 1 alpha subcomplex assembly factor 7